MSKISFKEYQEQYVTFLKSLIKTKLTGVLSKEIFEDYPSNLPKKYQEALFLETVPRKKIREVKSPSKRKYSSYTKQTMQLLSLDTYNLDFIRKIGLGEAKEFIKTNPSLKDVYSEKHLKDNSLNGDMKYGEWTDFINLGTTEVKLLQSKEAKNERIQRAFQFDQWLAYQELITAFVILESFLRVSYDYYLETFPSIEGYKKRYNDSSDLWFSKLFRFFMKEELRIVQRFGKRNREYIERYWCIRNAVVHNGGVINEKILEKYPKLGLPLELQVEMSKDSLEKLYKTIGLLQNIIYKKARIENKKKKSSSSN